MAMQAVREQDTSLHMAVSLHDGSFHHASVVCMFYM